MKRYKKPIIVLIIVLAFIGLGATNLVTSKRAEDKLKQQLNSEQLKQRDTQEQLKVEETDHSKTQEEKQKLEQQNLDQQKKIQELEQQLSVRRENAAKLAAAVTMTARASAASMPAGCDNVRTQLAAIGVTGAEADAAVNIASRESGCTPCKLNGGAINCGYTGNLACNVFQELPCGKWGSNAGDVAAHFRGADSYAKGRYGSWQGAWAAWQNKHWW